MRKIPAASLAIVLCFTACVEDAPYPFSDVDEASADCAPLRLNELNGNDKFIEIINTGSEAVNLAGVTLVGEADAAIWSGTARALAPGAVLLLYGEDVAAPGGPRENYDASLVFSGGLSARRAVRIRLKDQAGKVLDDFNLVTLLKPQAPASYSRVPDGTGAWYYTAATPGAPNATDTDGAVFE